jgi:hypothetical protein
MPWWCRKPFAVAHAEQHRHVDALRARGADAHDGHGFFVWASEAVDRLSSTRDVCVHPASKPQAKAATVLSSPSPRRAITPPPTQSQNKKNAGNNPSPADVHSQRHNRHVIRPRRRGLHPPPLRHRESASRILDGLGGAEQGRLVERLADQLQAERRAFRRQPAGTEMPGSRPCSPSP